MPIETLEKRIARLNQQKVKLAIEESAIKLKARKQRTANLIELGGLVVKAKLDNLKTNQLYGALLFLADELNRQPSKIEQFQSIGASAFQKENVNKTPVILKFNKRPDLEIRKNIRDIGLKWNKIRCEWEGYADLKKLESAVKDLKCEIIKVNPNPEN